MGKGKEGETGWSVSGWDYQKDREQIVRATVGAGEIVVRKDAETGADSTAGLNRDVNKAYEITKDEESRTDLYASSSSLGAVASPKKAYEQWKKSVELYGEKSRETMVKLALLLGSMGVLIASPDNLQGTSEDINRVLVETEKYLKAFSKDENRRAEAIEFRLKQKFGDPKADGEKLLLARMQEIARQSPEKSVELTALIGRLNDSPAGANNYVQGVATSGVMIALAGAMLYQASTAESQERMRNTANSLVENAKKAGGFVKEEMQNQIKISIGLWEFITLTAFPVHLLDDENRKLVNPIVDTSGGNPASGGYAEGGGVITTPHTGGTQLDGVQKDGAYVTPEHKLNPGVMYSEGGTGKGDATIIDSAILAQRVMDARAGLPSDLRRGGNVAVADIDIPGVSRQMAAHSGVSVAGRGFIGEGSGNFVAQIVPNKAGDPVYRGTDSEYKILDNIADQLGGNRAVSGAVNIFTEKPACVSCLGAGEQFNERYPNITVNFIDNQGVMLRPPRRIP
ncbi:adhesin/hemagglutinin [Pseudomonas sp. St29]|nr:deaminase domain-containing protein [Pseudomonas sp. St29]BAQ79495.1 adhesin/hemagglutinin [Pseudomonas sp. St29]